jgi:hypothetical protein
VGSKIAARTASVFDNDILSEPLSEVLPDDASDRVGDSPRRESNNKCYRMLGVASLCGGGDKAANITASAIRRTILFAVLCRAVALV